MTKVLLETNGFGNGDWFRLFVDDKLVDEGHSVSFWTLEDLINAVTRASMSKIEFERNDYDDGYFQ